MSADHDFLSVVRPFYDSLTDPAHKDVSANVLSCTANDFVSYGGADAFKGRDAFIGQVQGFGKMIPDLHWDVKETIPSACGTKVIVRSVASGTPVPGLMGVPNPEGKKFSIYAIDLHQIVDGKMKRADHAEDWATAFKQLKGEFQPQEEAPHVGGQAVEAQGQDLDARARAIVAPFYEALNHAGTADIEALVTGATHESWTSFGGEHAYKNRAAFIDQVKGFGKLIPDLKWDIQDVIAGRCGNKIAVRSIASGSPVGPFMGVQPTGKKFSIYAIDLHTVKDGKLARADHVEDWKTAIAQLSAQ